MPDRFQPGSLPSSLLAVSGLALLVSTATAGSASASGGLNCRARDGSVDLELRSGVSRGLGGALFQFKAELRLKAKGIAPDLAKTAFAQENIAHSWVVGREARLLLYREREGSAPHGYVQITLLTRAKPESMEAAGTYEVTVFDAGEGGDGAGRSFKGRANCSFGE